MIKSIGYAYPTSTTATKYGLGNVGCYFVELIGKGLKREGMAGPYLSVAEAEAVADKTFDACEYWDSYRRFPLNGSKFAEAK